eukprot:augustus_masked-scaffold_6-processed-gene-12.43-mRNA-1 protein AED:1.00 eAED:1.00 QI:0/-1/0/0/-1/1/1/0/2180
MAPFSSLFTRLLLVLFPLTSCQESQPEITVDEVRLTLTNTGGSDFEISVSLLQESVDIFSIFEDLTIPQDDFTIPCADLLSFRYFEKLGDSFLEIPALTSDTCTWSFEDPQIRILLSSETFDANEIQLLNAALAFDISVEPFLTELFSSNRDQGIDTSQTNFSGYLEPFNSFALENRLQLEDAQIVYKPDVVSYDIGLLFNKPPIFDSPQTFSDCNNFFLVNFREVGISSGVTVQDNFVLESNDGTISCTLSLVDDYIIPLDASFNFRNGGNESRFAFLSFSLQFNPFTTALEVFEIAGDESSAFFSKILIGFASNAFSFNLRTDPGEVYSVTSPEGKLAEVTPFLSSPSFTRPFFFNSTSLGLRFSNQMFFFSDGETSFNLVDNCSNFVDLVIADIAHNLSDLTCIVDAEERDNFVVLNFQNNIFNLQDQFNLANTLSLTSQFLKKLHRGADIYLFRPTVQSSTEYNIRFPPQVSSASLSSNGILELTFSAILSLGVLQSAFPCNVLLFFQIRETELIPDDDVLCRIQFPPGITFRIRVLFLSEAFPFFGDGSENVVLVTDSNLRGSTGGVAPGNVFGRTSILAETGASFRETIAYTTSVPTSVSGCEERFFFVAQQESGLIIDAVFTLLVSFTLPGELSPAFVLTEFSSSGIFEINILKLLQEASIPVSSLVAASQSLGIFQLNISVIDRLYSLPFPFLGDSSFALPYDIDSARLPLRFDGFASGSSLTELFNEQKLFESRVSSIQRVREAGFCKGEIFEDPGNPFLFRFKWEFIGTATGALLLSKEFTSSRLMLVKEKELPFGDYDVSLEVSPINTQSTISANTLSFGLNIVPSPLVLVIDQPTSIFSTSVTVSARASCNPNALASNLCDSKLGYVGTSNLAALTESEARLEVGLSGTFVFEWTCIDEFDSCIDLEISDPFATRTSISLDSDFATIQLRVSDSQNPNLSGIITFEMLGQDSNAFNPNLDPIECNQVFVDIPPVFGGDSRINPDLPLTLRSQTSSQLTFSPDPRRSSLIYQWKISSGTEPSSIINSQARFDRPELFLPSLFLTEGEDYQFSVSLKQRCRGTFQGEAFEFDSNENTAEISFSVNDRPFGGSITADVIDGDESEGQLRLATFGWLDSENDFPLKFRFEYAFIEPGNIDRAGFEVEGNSTKLFNGFSNSKVANIFIPTPNRVEVGKSLIAFAVATDSLGTTSRRLSSVSIDLSEFVGVQNTKFAASSVLITKLQFGESDEVPNVAVAAVGTLSGDLVAGLQNVLTSVKNALAIFEENGTLNFASLTTTLQSLNIVSSAILEVDIDSLPDEVFSVFQGLVVLLPELNSAYLDLISATRLALVENNQTDLLAGRDTFNSIQAEFAAVTANMGLFDAKATQALRKAGELRGVEHVHRFLQNSDYEPCQFANNARDNLIRLSQAATVDSPIGMASYTRSSGSVTITSTKDTFSALGTSVTTLNSFRFPENFVSHFVDKADTPSELTQVDIVSIDWEGIDFISQCQRTRDLVFRRNETTQDASAEPDCLREYKYEGPPLENVGTIKTLEFISLETNEKVDVSGLDADQKISVVFDYTQEMQAEEEFFSLDICASEDVCGVDLFYSGQRVCGAFSEENSDWLQDGCTLSASSVESGSSVECVCTHATDYSTWVQFTNDIQVFEVGGSNVEMTKAARFMLVVVFPCIFCFFALLFYWAWKRDEEDLNKVKRAATATIILNRVVKKQKKRTFFERYYARRDGQGFKRRRRFPRLNKAKQATGKLLFFLGCFIFFMSYKLIRRFVVAMSFEHSLFGLRNFDPHYTRIERVAVFFSVVISTMFATAFFFRLQCADDLDSLIFIVAVAVAGALLGSVFSKFLLRSIFVSTAARVGSPQEISANLFKVLHRVEVVDGVESNSDEQLVNAYANLVKAENQIALSTRNLSSTNSSSGNMKEITNSEMSPYFIPTPYSENIGKNSSEHFSLSEAKVFLKHSKEEANAALVLAKKNWQTNSNLNQEYIIEAIPVDDSHPYTLYTPAWERQAIVAAQSNPFMRTFSLFAGKSHRRRKARRSRLSYRIKIFTWIILLLLLAFAIFYIYTWIRTRYVVLLNDDVLNAEEADAEFIEEWATASVVGIVISFLIAEPLVIFAKFSLIPLFVETFGNTKTFSFEENTSTWFKYMIHKTNKTKIYNKRTAAAMEVLADVVEALF